MGNNSIKPLKTLITHTVMTSLLLSAFIYLEHFEFSYKLLNTVLGILGLYFLLKSSKKEAFFIGAFTSFFWFYWVGMSFRFTDFPLLTYFIPLGIMLVYGVIFYLIYWFENIYYRSIITLFAFDFIEPFGFTWFKFETLFASSLVFPSKLHVGAVLIAIILFIKLEKQQLKFLLPILPILLSINYQEEKIPDPKLKIKLVDLTLDQNTKWLREYRKKYTEEALEHIRIAIKEDYDVVVVPESAIPLYLNRHPSVIEVLKNLSLEINIVLGSLKYKDKKAYNSTYIFKNGELQIADKVFLVPFGEASPITGVFGKWVNDTFFDSTDDFITAQKPTDYILGDDSFRAAICYEAGVEAMFKNSPKYMIAISNNAWFVPSIMPTIQKLVMLTWGRKYSVKIYHSTNKSKSFIVN